MSGTPLLSRLLGAAFAALLALASFAPEARAQGTSRDEFRAGFNKGYDLGDAKLMDQWMKRMDGASRALNYFEELAVVRFQNHDADGKAAAKMEALQASFERVFEGKQTMRKVQRWVDGMDAKNYESLQKGRDSSAKLWQTVFSMQQPTHDELLTMAGQFETLAQAAKAIGHQLEAAELYGLAAATANKLPAKDRAMDDRKRVLQLYSDFLASRDAWDFVGDTYYLSAANYVKDEKARIADDEKKADKRKAEGYSGNTKGIEALVLPNVAEEKKLLEFKALQTYENELDYGPKNGPVPPLWWLVSLGKEGEERKFDWFRRRDMYMVRTGAAKFAVGLTSGDTKNVVEVQASGKPKVSSFWLDNDKKVPYAMFFWVGSDRERIGDAEQNVMPSSEVAQVYYRSAASWQGEIGGETVVFYDDNASGQPGDGDVWEAGFKTYSLGNYDGQGAGTPAPVMDSMRIGKGPRVPFSEFVHIGDQWLYVHRTQPEQVGVRPLNPEYFKTGKLKLVWNGPKPTAPVQLVVQGTGDYKTAYFDLAAGKEVDVPVGDYSVIFGRFVNGKGARAQVGTLYQGDSKPITVEEGKTATLTMGAPFDVAWTRHGDQNLVVDALKIFVKEASGCLITDLHGMSVVPEVMAAKDATGKGAKVVGKFVPFTDGELVNVAGRTCTNLSTLCSLFPMPQGYSKGALTLAITLPSDGMKVALVMKKHALFGPLGPIWQ